MLLKDFIAEKVERDFGNLEVREQWKLYKR